MRGGEHFGAPDGRIQHNVRASAPSEYALSASCAPCAQMLLSRCIRLEVPLAEMCVGYPVPLALSLVRVRARARARIARGGNVWFYCPAPTLRHGHATGIDGEEGTTADSPPSRQKISGLVEGVYSPSNHQPDGAADSERWAHDRPASVRRCQRNVMNAVRHRARTSASGALLSCTKRGELQILQAICRPC